LVRSIPRFRYDPSVSDKNTSDGDFACDEGLFCLVGRYGLVGWLFELEGVEFAKETDHGHGFIHPSDVLVRAHVAIGDIAV
jgi:hypothetical protein